MIRVAFALTFLAAPLLAQANGAPPTRSAAQHGAYSESQAAEGEIVYKKVCASCHELSFHTGEEFKMNWFSRNVWDLFKILKTTMPEDNIGGLSDDEYTRVIAYVFKLNGFPASTDSLKADSLEMRKIRIGPIAADTTKPPTRRR
jgi:mono/diheme cytochrome c family protein